MLNRANRRQTIFTKEADYEAFEHILTDAVQRFDIELFSYYLLPNHWHLVIRPGIDGEMSRFAKSFPVQCDEHFLTVNRYVECNAYSAGLCDSPERWRYGSLSRWKYGSTKERSLLTAWPVPRRADWVGWVTAELSTLELARLKRAEQRGAPFGEETWVESIARKFDLESTLRPRGRPRKMPRSRQDSLNYQIGTWHLFHHRR